MRFYIQKDRYNENRNDWIYKAVKDGLQIVETPEESDAFLVIGGDGSLLSAVRDQTRLRKPILALNGGTVGANLIDVTKENITEIISEIQMGCVSIESYPVFNVQAKDAKGNAFKRTVFNDAWVDRLGATSVRYRSKMIFQGQEHELSDFDFSGDGILFSSATGSTGYARMNYDIILPHGMNVVLCVPMASVINKRKVPATMIGVGDEFIVEFVDTEFRPTRLAVDGVYLKNDDGSDFCPVSISVMTNSEREEWIKMITLTRHEHHAKQFNFIGR
ncbi:putative NAD(+) kinase [Vibrio chagasii]|nr:putative NAD(+) kinase [Vibrio chagasii]